MFPAVEIDEVTFVEKTQLKIISFQNNKHLYLIHTWSDNSFKTTIVNRTSFTGGYLKIMLTISIKAPG